jgi:hypothetical protein
MRRTKEGLEILLSLIGPNDRAELSAEHDVLYASGPDPNTLPSETVSKLDDLGWYWSDEHECWRKWV